MFGYLKIINSLVGLKNMSYFQDESMPRRENKSNFFIPVTIMITVVTADNCQDKYSFTKCLREYLYINIAIIDLKVQSCKLRNNKYMIAALTRITNTEIFAFITVLVIEP